MYANLEIVLYMRPCNMRLHKSMHTSCIYAYIWKQGAFALGARFVLDLIQFHHNPCNSIHLVPVHTDKIAHLP